MFSLPLHHNANYSCSVTRVVVDGTAVHVSFSVTGDGSLGDLQNPSRSQLQLVEQKAGNGSQISDEFLLFSDKSQFKFSPNSSSGTLLFELPARLLLESCENFSFKKKGIFILRNAPVCFCFCVFFYCIV